MRTTTKVSSNYTVVIPEGVRTHLGITKGDILEVRLEGDDIVFRRSQPLRARVNTEGGAVKRVRERLTRRRVAS